MENTKAKPKTKAETETEAKVHASKTAPKTTTPKQDGAVPHDLKGADIPDTESQIDIVTDKWKRALADAENARKRADTARLDGREHGIAVAVEALAPALDALSLGIETARADPHAKDPRMVAHLKGLHSIRAAFETGLKALGVRTIAPVDTPFDPKYHEAMGTQATAVTTPGQVLVLHRPGFAIGQRLIRPAHVTVSAAPAEEPEG